MGWISSEESSPNFYLSLKSLADSNNFFSKSTETIQSKISYDQLDFNNNSTK